MEKALDRYDAGGFQIFLGPSAKRGYLVLYGAPEAGDSSLGEMCHPRLPSSSMQLVVKASEHPLQDTHCAVEQWVFGVFRSDGIDFFKVLRIAQGDFVRIDSHDRPELFVHFLDFEVIHASTFSIAPVGLVKSTHAS